MSATPRILIVEDELLVALDVEATLREQQWEVMGPVPSVARALSLLETQTPDAVCLDMNLNGTISVHVAEVLKARGIPFVIVTGYNEGNVLDPAFKGAPIVNKPFAPNELVVTLTGLLS